jgi:hypothetical protein
LILRIGLVERLHRFPDEADDRLSWIMRATVRRCAGAPVMIDRLTGRIREIPGELRSQDSKKSAASGS